MPVHGMAMLERIRKFCLTLDGASEKVAWGEPTFRVRDRIFAIFSTNHHDDGRIAVVCPAPDGMQRDLVAADPAHFYVPPYVGGKGWIGIRVDGELPFDAIAPLVEQAHAMTAAKGKKKRARAS